MATTLRQVRLAARTTTGTQDFTVPGLGASSLIKAAVFVASLATADASPVAGASLSVGHTTGSAQYASSTCSRDNTTTPSSFSQASDTDVILLLDPASADIAGPSVSVYARAEVVGFINDGVRVNWTTAPPAGVFVTCLLAAGAQVSRAAELIDLADADLGTSPNLITRTNFRFAAQLAFFVSAPMAAFDNTPVATASMHFGAVRTADSFPSNCAVAWSADSSNPAPTASVVNSICDASRAIRRTFADSAPDTAEVVNRIGNGLGIDCTDDPLECSVLSLLFDDARVWVGQVLTPQSTSAESIVDPGFRPQCVILVGCRSTSDRNLETGGDAGPFAIGIVDRHSAYSTAIACADDVATTDTQSLVDSHALHMPSHDGVDPAIVIDAELIDEGFAWALASGTDTARVCLAIAIGEGVEFSTSGSSELACAGSGAGAVPAPGSGASSASSSATGKGAIAGATSGVGDARSSATGTGAASGQTSGASSAAAACGGTGALLGSATGGSQAAALLTGRGEVLASSTSMASCVAQLGARGALAGDLFAASMLFIDDGIVPEVLGVYRTIGKLARDRVIAGVQIGQARGVAYDNLPFPITGTAAFVRAHVAVADGRQISFGAGNRYRKSGELVARVHVPFGTTAAADALAIANGVRDALTDVFVEHVNFRTAWIEGEGARVDADWVVEVRAPFEADVVLELQASVPPDGVLDPIVAGTIARDRMRDLVATPLALTVEYGGVPEADHDADETWTRFSVHSGRRFVVEPGTQKRYRTPGLIRAAIFAPPGRGDRDSVAIADAIADAFRAVSDRGVTFETPVAHEGRRDGAWWRVDVTCAFSWDELV